MGGFGGWQASGANMHSGWTLTVTHRIRVSEAYRCSRDSTAQEKTFVEFRGEGACRKHVNVLEVENM